MPPPLKGGGWHNVVGSNGVEGRGAPRRKKARGQMIKFTGRCGIVMQVIGGRTGGCKKFEVGVDPLEVWRGCQVCEFAKDMGVVEKSKAEVAPETVPEVPVVKEPVEGVMVPSGDSSAVGTFSPEMVQEARALDLVGEKPSILEAVMEELGVPGGPSTGGVSQHALLDYVRCPRRAYEAYVLGLRDRGNPRWADEGTAFHASMWLHRSSGGRRTFELCDRLKERGEVELAERVRHWVTSYLMKFAVEEAQTWDLRALEKNAVWWVDVGDEGLIGEKLYGYVPVSARLDVLVARKGINDPVTPWDQKPPGGVWVNDEKTTSRMDAGLVTHFAMSWQFRVYSLLYRRALEAEMGRFAGVIVSVMPKTKAPKPVRIYDAADEERLRRLDQWDAGTFRPALRAFVEQLLRDREDASRWSQNLGIGTCTGKYTCRYIDICDISERMRDVKIVDRNRIIDPNKWVVPKELVAQRKKERLERRRGKDVLEVQDQKKLRRKLFREAVTKKLCELVDERIDREMLRKVLGEKTKKEVIEEVSGVVKELREELPLSAEVDGEQVSIEWTEERVIWSSSITQSRSKYDLLIRKCLELIWSNHERLSVHPVADENEDGDA
ncbi:MAG: hypothetical protein D6812_11855 [Deltaproteobacteria bacterium]|nr:MAG: hypothetical protein D6812_11855 [Deltaproteobacteria bacterium]